MNTDNCPHCGKSIDITLTKAGAATSPRAAETSSDGWIPVDRVVECNRCGENPLAWQKAKSGKYYLCRARQEADGRFFANRREFHKCGV